MSVRREPIGAFVTKTIPSSGAAMCTHVQIYQVTKRTEAGGGQLFCQCRHRPRRPLNAENRTCKHHASLGVLETQQISGELGRRDSCWCPANGHLGSAHEHSHSCSPFSNLSPLSAQKGRPYAPAQGGMGPPQKTLNTWHLTRSLLAPCLAEEAGLSPTEQRKISRQRGEGTVTGEGDEAGEQAGSPPASRAAGWAVAPGVRIRSGSLLPALGPPCSMSKAFPFLPLLSLRLLKRGFSTTMAPPTFGLRQFLGPSQALQGQPQHPSAPPARRQKHPLPQPSRGNHSCPQTRHCAPGDQQLPRREPPPRNDQGH